MTYKAITIDQLWEVMTVPERDAMVGSRDLPMWFIEKFWNEMTRYQQKRCIAHQAITLSFYARKWVLLGGDVQREVVKYKKLSDTFVYDHWETTNWFAQTDILLTMNLSEATCERCWAPSANDHFTAINRTDICRSQQLPMQFIETHWDEMTEEQKKKCYITQHLTPEFALQHWEELDKDSRKECVVVCINKAPEALLPSFLTSTDKEVRQVAISRMSELLERICDGGKRIEVPDVYE